MKEINEKELRIARANYVLGYITYDDFYKKVNMIFNLEEIFGPPVEILNMYSDLSGIFRVEQYNGWL